MLWVVLTVLAGLIVLGCLIGAGASTTPEGKTGSIIAGVVTVVVWVILSFFMSLHTVGQREVGLVQSFSGTISDGFKSPGVVMTAPWNHIKKENVGLTKEVFVFGADNSAVSKDQQPITAVLVVNYQVAPSDAVALWKNVGPNWKNTLLDGRIPQDFKETTAQFTSPQITLERPKLRLLTLERLRKELCPPKGEFCIHVQDVFVQNVGYSSAYTQAIEQKQVQVQAALQAQAKVAQSEAEARQAVAVANGERDAAIAKAEGDAKSIELQGKALKNNPEVIRYQTLQKLSAQAQVIFCTNGNCPSILGSLTK